ncbi:MAG: hypothetical protein JRN08_06945 [Nitrososphaerota archaeon]|nr:hypothetical protein [Nitrososphaerota archaeon]
MSTTIRISEKDRESLEALRKRIGAATITETVRYAIAMAEAGDEKFTGDVGALDELLRAAGRSSKGRVKAAENVDEELARVLTEESARR